MTKELILGAGEFRRKRMSLVGQEPTFENPVFLDINPDTNPDIIFDLNRIDLYNVVFPYNEEYDEIHAYEILEHLGSMGDEKFFFKQFSEFWRILKPNGMMFISVPDYSSPHAVGDPGHRRIFSQGSFAYLSRGLIDLNRKLDTSMTNYDHLWTKDFEVIFSEVSNDVARILSVILVKKN